MEERELLRILETAFIHLKKDVFYKETKRKYQQALEEIAALIQKPRVTEKWLDEKAHDLHRMYHSLSMKEFDRAKDFIRSLVEEIRGKC